MARFGFVSGSYQSQSLNADCQKCLNWYVEVNESGAGKSAMSLYPTPGLNIFASLPGAVKVPRLYDFNGRLFAIAESLQYQILWEVFANGTSKNWGQLGLVGSQPYVAANSVNQLLISSAGRLFLFNIATNVIAEIDTTNGTALQGPVSQVTFGDGYFIALLANSQKFQISQLLNGTSWNPLDIGQVSLYADNVLSMEIDHRQLILFGPKRTVIYENTGNPLFPIEPVQGGFIEQGIAAPHSRVRLDNSVFWIGGDERGDGIAWKISGATPARVSNHAIEFAWSQYPTISDAIGYAYQDQGHAFWVLRFPTANKTWVFDAATGMWHERGYLDGTAHRSTCHTKWNGKHLVGDWNSGNIYEMSINFLTDAGASIHRVRRSPHVSREGEPVFHDQLYLDVETGIAGQPPLLDGQGKPRGPQIMMRFSNNAGHTWSNEQWRDAGQAGEYTKRVQWNRLGMSRTGRVYEISTSDPWPCRIIDAYLKARPDYQPSERLTSQMRKGA